jgi:hypothetical protein
VIQRSSKIVKEIIGERIWRENVNFYFILFYFILFYFILFYFFIFFYFLQNRHRLRVATVYVGVVFIIVIVNFYKMETIRFNIICQMSFVFAIEHNHFPLPIIFNDHFGVLTF